ncbi:MAG: preprotein translocase subunit SecE [Solirubrobacteraceae bacterium]
MARDRKRAKRRARAQAQGGSRARAERPAPGADASGADAEPATPAADRDDTLAAPSPLEHSSADIDLVEAELEGGAGGHEPPSDGAAAAETAEEAFERTPEGERMVAARKAEEPALRRRRGAPRVIEFLRASWRELQRVQWPDRRAVAQATAVVIVFVVVAGAFLGLMDFVSSKLVDAIL